MENTVGNAEWTTPEAVPAESADAGSVTGERADTLRAFCEDAEAGKAGCPDLAGTPEGDEESGSPEAVPLILGVRLRRAGMICFFRSEGLSVRFGSKVLVEFEQGTFLGEVVAMHSAERGSDAAARDVDGRVLGLASEHDIARDAENAALASEAMAFCRACISQRDLDMKLVDVEILHDRGRFVFFFTAPARIDFRELVKDLVRNYRTRIELRQIGVRHETQMVGGLGNCGMVCCCRRYLRKFAPVTIKMAKEQNLFLNPAKLSGMCGRLLCCLSFEQANYEQFNHRCPKMGKKYTTSRGIVKIMRANMFNQSISVCSDTGEEWEFSLEEWDGLEPKRVENAEPSSPKPSPGASAGERGPVTAAPPPENGRRGNSRARRR